MLSRVADSIYWMARSMERAENLARLLQANSQLYLDAGAAGGAEAAFWQPILMTTGEEEAYAGLYPRLTSEGIAEFLSVHEENPNCIRNCIRGARENARMIRDQISDETWQALNHIHLFLHSPKAEKLRLHDPTEYYEAIIRASFLFQGVARSTLGRGESWIFLQIGTYLERADQTSRLVDACSNIPLEMPPHPQANPLRWASLLHSCSAYHAFRVGSNHLEPRRILDFLFLSEEFPRSVRFCMREVDRSLRELGRPEAPGRGADPLRLSGRLRADLDFSTVGEILAEGVHEFIDRLQTRLIGVGNAVFQTFVLYADLVPVDVSPAPAVAAVSLGAWRPGDDAQRQQQQQ